MDTQRIIISTSSLTIEDWTDIYRFIDSIFTNGSKETKLEALHNLQEKCIDVWCAPASNIDVYQLDGNELTDEVLMQLSKNTCYSILYQKDDDIEEFTGFAPFVFFLHKFFDEKRSLVSLGINTDAFKDQAKAKSFKFKCSNFFILNDMSDPTLGEKTIFFFSKANKTTTILAGKRRDTDYHGDPSRRFLPLLHITEDNYHSIFTSLGSDASKKSDDFKFINDSLNKIKADLKDILKKQKNKLNLIDNPSDSLFGQWLINGYFNSYESVELKSMSLDDIKGTIQTLQIYKNSIFELIQNIIFHGGKKGLFYCVFDKKENVSSFYQNKLPDFNDSESKVNRFLRVGIYDYHETGIVDSFKEREKNAETKDASNKLSLKDFFDPNSVATIGITKLEMRYAARLGIKSFVKTVFGHNGYFSVESNEVVDGHNSKKRISSIWKDGRPGFPDDNNLPITEGYAPGTHYEIVLPVMSTPLISAPALQKDSFFNLSQTLQSLSKSYQPITAIDIDFEKMARISDSTTKEQQIEAIINVGNDIIKNAGSNRSEIALNLKGKVIDHTLLFKILAYVQLKAKKGFRKIILINGTDDFVKAFCELISPFLNDTIDDEVPIWSDKDAIILMSEKFHVKIICGEKREEFYALNREFQKYYCNNTFPEKNDNDNASLFINHGNNYPKDNLPGEFILPYDILVEPKQGTTLFESYALDLLKRKIISNDIGFLVNHENTYIGNKIIVINYYEADLMFQNSFFAERFAFLIAKNIRKLERAERKQLVLIGYQQYSEYLLKAIKRIVNDKTVHIAMATANDETAKEKAKDEIAKNETACNESANDGKHALDIELSFNFDIDGNNSELRDRILNTPEQFQFATIVPIGATLSTNDKIVALFKLWHKLHNPQKRESTNIEFIYNHCVIIVRDTISTEPTPLEKEQQWEEIQIDKRLIKTDFRNATEIHYTIQTAKADNPTDNNWLKRLNKKVSFPDNWVDEKYVNFTENSSINSQNLMGFPKVDTSDEIDHPKELERLYEFKDDIYKGHFDAFKSHHKYFFDTESFVRRKNKLFKTWLDSIKTHFQNEHQQNKLNILITPNAETESDLVCNVNDYVFGGNALIVYLDVKNWRNNIVYKLSFLKNMDRANVSFHYVDHLLLTGETYHRTKSYLYSIKGGTNPIIFDSIITVINRLPYTTGKEIKNDVNHFFAFINLYYPTSKLDGRECELCKLQRYYDDLSKKTVLESCKQAIKKNVDKLICKSRRELEQSREKRDAQQINRDFLRLVTTHELYYRISQIAWGQANKAFDSTKDDIYYELDAIYCKLCNKECPGDKDTESIINNRINEWYKSDFPEEYSDLIEHQSKKLETDKIIAFLKVISSPPLSKYIIIREYAQRKLLSVLYEIINEKNEKDYTYDDLIIVKSILKSLSFLKSNALVRKGVIVGVWEVLDSVINNLNTTKEYLNRIEKNTLEISIRFLGKTKEILNEYEKDAIAVMNSIDAELERLNTKTQLTISEGDKRNHLIPALNCLKYLIAEKERIEKLSDQKDEIIKDFSRDIQFFIKNAIVEDDAKATFLGELLRQGDELSFDNYNILISATKLISNKNNQAVNTNNLFEYFSNKGLARNDFFNNEYTKFLVWVFYDNTTIIRKTLDNFSNELTKDLRFYLSFKYKDKDKNQYLLKDIEYFKNSFNRTVNRYENKIDSEYYYASFKPYLLNGDDINYVKKLIYVLYAKLKLEDLIVNKHKTSIETDIKDLLNIFSEIMGADSAFLILRKDRKAYPVSVYKKDDPEIKWNYEDWFLNSFYTRQILSLKSLIYPNIPLYNIQKHEKSSQPYGERDEDLEAHSLNIFVTDHSDINTRATITFLYEKDNLLTRNETKFRIHMQESGRLLLLLKNEIDRYLIDYLINEKVFDLWLENDQSYRKFEKIYSKSNHTFNAVFDEMDEFEELNESIIRQSYQTWYFLTNQTINFFYSNIERNRSNGAEPMNCLTLDDFYILDAANTLGDTFNHKFITILLSLLNGRWNNNDKKKDIIMINKQQLEKFKLGKNLMNVKMPIHKHLMRTFIVQCLHNSLAYNNHGHRNWGEIKRIDITITDTIISIEDHCIKNVYTKEEKAIIAQKFEKKKQYIRRLNCDEYSSTTLTAIQGVFNYLNEGNANGKYRCEYGFNENYDFKVTFFFNKI